MQSAAIYLLASTLAVTYGWQPMPDGSDSYEYVVQLDRELLTRLERGESIPISADIPEEIQPIRRIRLVVGNQDLPRQKLVTAFKPEQKEDAGDVVRGQFSDVTPRYNNQPILPANRQPAQILPSSRQIENTVNNIENRVNNSVNALGDALQRSAQEARNTVEAQILPRNNQQAQNNQIRPRQSGDILPRTSTAGQPNQIRNTNSSNDSAIRELFAEPRNNTRASNVQMADQRNAAENRNPAGNRTNNQSILPRGNNSNAVNNTPLVNNTPATNRNTYPSQRANNPNSRYANSNQNQHQNRSAANISPPSRENRTTTNPQRIEAPWPEDERFQNSPLAQEYRSQDGRYPNNDNRTSNPPETNSKSNPYNYVENPQRNNNQPTPNLTFPEHSNFNTAGNSRKNSRVPEIREEMLERPADRELRMADGNRSLATPAAFAQPPEREPLRMNSMAQQPPQQKRYSNIVSTPAPENRNQNRIDVPQPNKNPSGDNTVPLILAWVLLCGSGSGNLYLGWSYLDIRGKYRGLVRSAGRKLGRRYLDDRYGDRDDYDE